MNNLVFLKGKLKEMNKFESNGIRGIEIVISVKNKEYVDEIALSCYLDYLVVKVNNFCEIGDDIAVIGRVISKEKEGKRYNKILVEDVSKVL